MKSKELTYREKALLSFENDEPVYDSMHEDYGVPDNKPGLLIWYIKNYIKGIKEKLFSIIIWIVASALIVSGFNAFFVDKIEPWLTKHNWNYLNNIREKMQGVYPYIFGADGRADLFEKYGHAYLKGFDEPWQFIYPKYTAYFDNGNGVRNPMELVRTGIFAVFFSYALISLIGIIVGKIRNQGAKALFVDFALIPKQVIEYGKRSETKVLDHFLLGTISAFIIGFIIKNPFAMPLLALYILISFTMGTQSSTIINRFASDCSKKIKENENKPLFADSALYIWGVGVGFILYSILGFAVWNKANFAFGARLVETLFWLALMVALYVIRNGKKASKVIAQSVTVALVACGTVMVQSLKAYATILEIWYDSNGNRIGQKIILDNKPDGQSYKKFRSSWPDGVAGGAGGANGGKKAGKNRIDKSRGVNTEMGRLRAHRDIIMDGRSLDELTPTERAEVDRINQLISDSKHGKVSNTDYEEQAAAHKEVAKKIVRGDLSADANATKSNAQINADAAKDALGNGFEEMARGETLGAKIARTTTGIATGGYSETVFTPAGAMYKAQDMVNEGRSAEDVISTTIIDSSVDLAVNEATGKVIEGGVKLGGAKLKLPEGAQSIDQLGEFKTILQNSDINSKLGRAALTYQSLSSVASGEVGGMLSEAAQNGVHNKIDNVDNNE